MSKFVNLIDISSGDSNVLSGIKEGGLFAPVKNAFENCVYIVLFQLYYLGSSFCCESETFPKIAVNNGIYIVSFLLHLLA
jgi:hypothetical protein